MGRLRSPFLCAVILSLGCSGPQTNNNTTTPVTNTNSTVDAAVETVDAVTVAVDAATEDAVLSTEDVLDAGAAVVAPVSDAAVSADAGRAPPPVRRDAGAPATTQGDPAAAGRGRTAFNRACGRCHPNGEEDVGPRLIGRNMAASEVRTIVRSGRDTMRAISPARLSDAELEDVFAYLRTIRAVR